MSAAALGIGGTSGGTSAAGSVSGGAAVVAPIAAFGAVDLALQAGSGPESNVARALAKVRNEADARGDLRTLVLGTAAVSTATLLLAASKLQRLLHLGGMELPIAGATVAKSQRGDVVAPEAQDRPLVQPPSPTLIPANLTGDNHTSFEPAGEVRGVPPLFGRGQETGGMDGGLMTFPVVHTEGANVMHSDEDEQGEGGNTVVTGQRSFTDAELLQIVRDNPGVSPTLTQAQLARIRRASANGAATLPISGGTEVVRDGKGTNLCAGDCLGLLTRYPGTWETATTDQWDRASRAASTPKDRAALSAGAKRRLETSPADTKLIRVLARIIRDGTDI